MIYLGIVDEEFIIGTGLILTPTIESLGQALTNKGQNKPTKKDKKSMSNLDFCQQI